MIALIPTIDNLLSAHALMAIGVSGGGRQCGFWRNE